MNFMEFACRGIVRNEDNIRRLNKNMTKLTKIVRDTNGIMFCVIYANAKDIELLKSRTKDLAREVEELKEQKGA